MNPSPYRHIPNTLTLLRIAMVPWLGWTLWKGEWSWALGILLAAGLSDALDGYLARRFHWRSRFGAALDPLADKLMLMTAFATLAANGAAPTWLAFLVLWRDGLILYGVVHFFLTRGPLPMRPTLLGKTTTAAQIFYGVCLIILNWLGMVALSQNPILIAPIVALTIFSGLDYIRIWWGDMQAVPPRRVRPQV
ncbi:MAG: CDP-alcohol phosphatidyltransferase [Alphaproteobacteria bacterium CG_4_10_14_0_2_um_filter_63_37]|nr:MAG: CDP-alcohol phosphatidyltransferase [Alphaproteobacteria bacterium CG_4_10_14_0_2_um_filter_63_37]